MAICNESVLLIEDDEGVALLEQRALERRGLGVSSVTNVSDALIALQSRHFDIVVADYQLECGTSLELLTAMSPLGLDTPVILVTGFSDEATIIEAMRCGARDFVPKTQEYLQYLPEAVERVLQAVRTERELARSKARFQVFMDNSPAAAFIKDEAGRWVYANRTAERNLAREDWLGKSDFELWPRDSAEKMRALDQQVLRAGHAMETRGPITLKSGETRYFHTYKFPMVDADGRRFLGGVAVDITEQQAAEEALRERDAQLRQSQKMEAVGTLAGGVAHEFNNLLQAVLGYTRFAIAEVGREHPALADLEIVVSAAERAAQLTQQLLSFSRHEPGELIPLDLNVAIQELTSMLRPLIGAQIEIELALDRELGLILADHIQVQQMLMNLCINARDAMPDGGRITISTRRLTKEESSVVSSLSSAATHIAIQVSDTGCGIPAEIRQKIFDPFFTTKPVGKGTGLGLAMVYGVVQHHGGTIRVDSQPGLGTSFTVLLPEGCAEAVAEEAQSPNIAASGAGTILLAEDEALLLEMTKRMLESAGYAVLTARDGGEAVRLFSENRERVDLVILDAVMPQKTGWDAVCEIRQLDASVPAVFTTGHDAYEARVLPDGKSPKIIYKPFELEELLEVVHELIAEQWAPCRQKMH